MAPDRTVSPELVNRVEEQARGTPSFFVFMALAGMLAAVGMLANSVPILIGAMIVAPALPPLALVAIAAAAGRPALALGGLAVGLGGIAVATLVAAATAWIMNVTGVIPAATDLLDKPLLDERTRPGWYSVTAAIAAGIAGMTALIKRKSDTLVGTVAALALVPASSAAAIALLAGDVRRAAGGLLLLGVNVGLIVAMGIVVLAVLVRTGNLADPPEGKD